MSEILLLNKKYIEKQISISDNIQNVKKNIKNNSYLNSYINFVNSHDYINNEKSLLNGIPYAVKDNINVINNITTGGSKFFENFISPFNASVIEMLNKNGAIPIVKTNLDEFGLGGDGLHSAYGDVINPFDKDRICGGSSSGSAVLVAKKLIPFALGTDTGDSIRKPSSFLGIIGYKPTYGLVSRYGVFPYSPTLDHLGVMTNNITDLSIVLDAIINYDEKDFTSQKLEPFYFYKNLNNFNSNNKPKIAIFKNILELGTEITKKSFHEYIEKIKSFFNIEYVDFDLEILKFIPTIYKIISYSEASSCYQNLTGICFGEKSPKKNYLEKVVDVRTKKLGKQLKQRFIFGSYCTIKENYEDIFLKSKKIRTLLIEQANIFLQKYDFIFMPGASDIPPFVKDVKSKKPYTNLLDDYLQIANFGGYPSITIPMAKIGNNFIGINIMSNINNDLKLIQISNYLLNLVEK